MNKISVPKFTDKDVDKLIFDKMGISKLIEKIKSEIEDLIKEIKCNEFLDDKETILYLYNKLQNKIFDLEKNLMKISNEEIKILIIDIYEDLYGIIACSRLFLEERN